jgi:hypothetical protein
MSIRIVVFFVMTRCCLLGEYQRYRERYCLHLQDIVNLIPQYVRLTQDQRFWKFESLPPRARCSFLPGAVENFLRGLLNDAFSVEAM